MEKAVFIKEANKLIVRLKKINGNDILNPDDLDNIYAEIKLLFYKYAPDFPLIDELKRNNELFDEKKERLFKNLNRFIDFLNDYDNHENLED